MKGKVSVRTIKQPEKKSIKPPHRRTSVENNELGSKNRSDHKNNDRFKTGNPTNSPSEHVQKHHSRTGSPHLGTNGPTYRWTTVAASSSWND